MPGRFAGRVAIVTGGGSGIGAATVRRLHAEGADLVIVADLDLRAARGVAAPLPRAAAHRVDVADPDSVAALLATAREPYGHVDLVVHAAGVDDPEAKAHLRRAWGSDQPLDVFRLVTDATWRRLVSVNLDGTLHVLRAAIDVLYEQGGGAVVVVSSSAAFDAPTGYAPYAATKAAVDALVQSVAKEAAHHGVRVNAVAPGPVDTPMAARVSDEARAADRATAPRPPASAEEIADTIAYLASPGAANIVGAVVLSNGGRFTA